MKEKVNRLAVLTKGIIKENPNLVLLLGTCPTLATTSSAFNGMGMGIAATAVLICSNIAISLLAKLIPDKVRIPCYIVLIAGFVTLVQFIVQAFAEPLYNSLGVFLPLIVVNCIILGRAEMFANKNGVLDSALDGIGMGLGFTTFPYMHPGAVRGNSSVTERFSPDSSLAERTWLQKLQLLSRSFPNIRCSSSHLLRADSSFMRALSQL